MLEEGRVRGQNQGRVRLSADAPSGGGTGASFVDVDATELPLLSGSAIRTPMLEILEVTYTPASQDVHISGGENAGRTLPHLNIVTDVWRIGYLERGARGRFHVRDSGEGKVVIVQDGKGGAICGMLRF